MRPITAASRHTSLTKTEKPRYRFLPENGLWYIVSPGTFNRHQVYATINANRTTPAQRSVRLHALESAVRSMPSMDSLELDNLCKVIGAHRPLIPFEPRRLSTDPNSMSGIYTIAQADHEREIEQGYQNMEHWKRIVKLAERGGIDAP